MTDIKFNPDTPKPVGNNRQLSESKSSMPSAGRSFQSLLDERLEPEKGEAALPGAPGGLSELSAPSPFSLSAPAPEELTEQISNTLDLLDRYASMVGDPGVSIKELPSLLSEISSTAEALSREARQGESPAGDLDDILEQILSTVRIQQIKLARGDYQDRF